MSEQKNAQEQQLHGLGKDSHRGASEGRALRWCFAEPLQKQLLRNAEVSASALGWHVLEGEETIPRVTFGANM